MSQQILGKKLLFVIAHPDDESFLASGTIWENYKAGGSSYIICGTKGEKGKSHLTKKVTGSQLKQIRKKELEKVSKFLKVKKLFVLSLPDTKVKDNKKELFEKVLKITKDIEPEFILSFGQDGISGHHDHIASGEVAGRVAKKLKLPFLSFARPPKLQNGKAKHWFRSRRKHGLYVDDFEYQKPNIKIKIDSEIKKKALSMHKSQIEGKNFFPGIPEKAVKELLNFECYVC